MITHHVLLQIKKWQKLDQTTVLVTGVFDILHIEHLRFLKKAKQAGDKLIVGIETDRRVKAIKGEHRPVNTQEVRLEQLNHLEAVDLAFLLPEQFNSQEAWEDLIKQIKPNIYAVSSHTSYLDNKKKITEKFAAELHIVHQFNPHYSSTKLFQQLIQED